VSPQSPPGRDYADDSDTVHHYMTRLGREIDRGALDGLTTQERRGRLEGVVGKLLVQDRIALSREEEVALVRRVVDEAVGLGVLEPLLADHSITEIMVNGPNDIFVERAGRLERDPSRFRDEEHLYQVIDRIVSAVNRRVDESSPMVDARLPTGERVNVIVPPLSLSGPVVTIRRFPRPYSLDELIGMGSLDGPTARLLGALVRARLNIIVSGGTGSGKTTLLNALSGFVPDEQRIITIEDAAELSLRQNHVISLESRPPNTEGRGEVTIRSLVRNSLRMRPDRIIVGEVRGGETLDMLQAMSTGHEGSLATVHANSAEDAVTRLATLASMSDLDIPFLALRDQINSAVDVVVHLARYPDGRRRVEQVAALSSRGRDDFTLTAVTRFEPEPVAADRIVRGRWRHLPLPPDLERRLTVAGETAFGVPPDGSGKAGRTAPGALRPLVELSGRAGPGGARPGLANPPELGGGL